ncbi:MAG: nucleotidyltransferase family protein [Clostridia bacterium]|nr:nucleotidyltransferase family protein [Clostridia bacterium]
MKIGLTICEYNPFHNGHLYSLNQIKEQLNPQALVVIMSGNFTERGEMAIMHKYKRAEHAIKAGADMVIELPTVFATAPAEIFAKGAVKLLSELKGDKTLCFGIESGTKSGLIATATALSSESKQFKTLLKEELKEGHSLAKARYNALEKLNPPGIDMGFTVTPNNILALEYTKAIIESGYPMDVLPITRKGTGYNEVIGKGNINSAKGIRELVGQNLRKTCLKYMPKYSFDDLPKTLPSCDEIIMYSLLATPKKQLAKILDCTEGLENRIKALIKDNYTRDQLIQALATRRYTQTRLSRITLACLLKIEGDFIEKCLKSDLYLKVLAIKKDKLNLLSDLAGNTPFIMRKKDADSLTQKAKECFLTDVLANDIYNLSTKTKTNEFHTVIVE